MIRILKDNLYPFHSEPVMKIPLFFSIILHVAIFLAFQNTSPLHWTGEDQRTYRVEFIRPAMDNINIDDLSETDIAHIKQEKKVHNDGGQETISLDTEDKRYISFTRIIKERIMKHWRYPPEARLNLIEGKLLIIFSLSRNGSLIKIEIPRHSGHKILDQEAARAVGKAAPFPRFPEKIIVNRLNIKASFDYRLKAGKKS